MTTKDYIDSEIARILPLTTVEEYNRLKKELAPADARFQFGKQCGYHSALCAIKNKLSESDMSDYEMRMAGFKHETNP